MNSSACKLVAVLLLMVQAVACMARGGSGLSVHVAPCDGGAHLIACGHDCDEPAVDADEPTCCSGDACGDDDAPVSPSHDGSSAAIMGDECGCCVTVAAPTDSTTNPVVRAGIELPTMAVLIVAATLDDAWANRPLVLTPSVDAGPASPKATSCALRVTRLRI